MPVVTERGLTLRSEDMVNTLPFCRRAKCRGRSAIEWKNVVGLRPKVTGSFCALSSQSIDYETDIMTGGSRPRLCENSANFVADGTVLHIDCNGVSDLILISHVGNGKPQKLVQFTTSVCNSTFSHSLGHKRPLKRIWINPTRSPPKRVPDSA